MVGDGEKPYVTIQVGMDARQKSGFFEGLLSEMIRLPRETEWVEFKENKADPQEIGEYISALSNSAALAGKTKGYLIWGIRDGDHAFVGTTFEPMSKKIGNEELESWLLRLLSPKINFTFHQLLVDEVPTVLLEIEAAVRNPVAFQNVEFIRIGSYKKKLKEFPEKERELWRIFDRIPFERNLAIEHITAAEIQDLLDVPSYLELMRRPASPREGLLLEALQGDDLIRSNSAGGWDITNLGAILFAKRLTDFTSVKRKSVRVVQYRGTDRIGTLREFEGNKGYGSGFEGLIRFLSGLLPKSEEIRNAIRQDVPVYPELAVRELVANALIHQDLFVTGAGPMVEIFEDRIEVTNPGVPLIDSKRFVDSAPQSRNEALASLMRRIGVCEERGSGWDKVVFLTEIHQLPAPLAEVGKDSTRIVLFAHRSLSRMDKEDRIRAVYLHACLRYVNREHMTNTSIRERFRIQQQNSANASRIIKEAVTEGMVVPYDSDAAPKLMRYVPYWAAQQRGDT